MGLVDKFERTLQGAVGDAFARVFGGNVVATEIETALKQEAEMRVEDVNGHLLAPNSYTVELGPSDYALFTEDELLSKRTFARHLEDFIAERGWEIYGAIDVEFTEKPHLHTGQLRTAGAIDPDSTPGQRGIHVSSLSVAEPRSSSAREGDAADIRHPANRTAAPVTGASQAARTTKKRNLTLALQDGSGRTYALQCGSNILGRGQDSHFRLPDTGVSRQHVDIRWDGRIAILSDLGSTNGTTVNGGPVQDWQLHEGDVICLGHSEIVVRES